jgi:ribosomal protein L17
LVDHLVLFAVSNDAASEDVEDLLSSIRALRSNISNVLDLSVGEDFSGRAGGYTHGLFVRFRTADDLREYLDHPDHRAVVEKLEKFTTGRLVADYDYEP